jgi:hypothetical protein
MDIEWRESEIYGTRLAIFDDLPMARVWESANGGWVCLFTPAIHKHFPDMPRTYCKTIAGIKRRVEKYITLWVIAGRPK